MATKTTEPIEAGVDVPVTRHGNLAAALAAFQAEIPSVVKGQQATVTPKDGGRSYTYEYADLAVITPIAMPLLGRHGLAFTSRPTLMGGAFVLDYALMHEGGEVLEGVYPLGDPLQMLPQKLGSAITYARRYAFCAVTGIAPGGDDDDAAAANDTPAAAATPTKTTRTRKTKAEPAPEPPAEATSGWAALILDVNTIDELRAVHARVEQDGELGMRFAEADARAVGEVVKHFELGEPPLSVTVGQFIGAVRKAIESKPTAEEEAGHPLAEGRDDVPAALADWDVKEIPADGETPS